MTTSLIKAEPNHHSKGCGEVPYLREMLDIARNGYSFQTRTVLQRIVMGEQQRIKEEQMLVMVDCRGPVMGCS